MNPAPVVLFVYNRPAHTKAVVEALLKNELASASDLFVYSDGPKKPEDEGGVNHVRAYIRSICGFRTISLIERDRNMGCAESIISGVAEIINRFGQIIVVEDDIVTSPYFLKFMNEALDYYRDNEHVACIHGYIYPVKARLPETFFLKGADGWGWATWKRGWNLFEPDGAKLLTELNNRNLTCEFNFDGAYPYTDMLEEEIKGKIDTWDIQWYTSTFLREKLTLYPGKSLVKNIGCDCSGTHFGATDKFDTDVSNESVKIGLIPIEVNQQAREAFKKFFRSLQPSLIHRAKTRIKRMMGGNL